MKVHMAYDDGTLIGVYRKRKDAKRALNIQARSFWFTHGWMGTVGQRYSKWSPCAGGIDREVTIDNGHREQTWEQWIDTYEVQP